MFGLCCSQNIILSIYTTDASSELAIVIKMAEIRKRSRRQSESSISSESENEDEPPPVELRCQEIDRPLAGYLRRHRITTTEESPQCRNVHQFVQQSTPIVENLLLESFDEIHQFKYQMRLKISFFKPAHPETTADAYFAHHQSMVLVAGDVANGVQANFAEIVVNVEGFKQRGSGWVVKSVDYMDIHIARYQPLQASSHIPLPSCLANCKAIINPQNYDDNLCFLYCILAALHPNTKDPARVSKWKNKIGMLKTDGLSFPIQISQIAIFESANKMSINVYAFDRRDKLLHPLYISPSEVECRHVNLLLLTDDTLNNHYCWIRNLGRLLYSQTGGKYKKQFCHRCLSAFKTEKSLKSHMEYCRIQKTVQRLVMPSAKDSDDSNDSIPPTLKFKQHRRALCQSLILYGDFECLNETIHSVRPANSWSYTRKLQQHTPCGFAIQPIFQCCEHSTSIIETPIIHRGPDAVEEFLNACLKRASTYQNQCDSRNRQIRMQQNDWKQFHSISNCQYCGEQFSSPDRCQSNLCQPGKICCIACKKLSKCRDHCHFCSKYRAAVHSQCNLKNRVDRDVVVILHNSRRYDTHLIMQKLGVVANQKGLKIDVIAKSSEDYISFSLISKHQHPTMKHKTSGQPWVFVWKLRFLDSFQFLSSSLDKLVANLLTKGKFNFKALLSRFPDATEHDLLLRKGVYPYSYMNSWLRFYETQLPPIQSFYNELTLTDLSVQDYDHAQNVFESFRIRNLGEYHDLYVLTDTLLLADIFQSFRKFGLEHYGLDPAHYLTLPSFGWSALLKMSQIELELITDSEMYRFFENGIRGGISVIAHRHAKANNPYLPNYDSSQPNRFIVYLDANNLYGYSMIQKLPTRRFKWLTDQEVSEFQLDCMELDPNIGYVLEIDLEYPQHLHDDHAGYPVAPEKSIINSDWVSPYCKAISAAQSVKVEKLIQTFNPKLNYTVHYQNLLLYSRLGVVVTKIHRVLSFEQTSWMKNYIEFNTEMRKKANSNFEKDLFKLLNNSVFGKSMENVREYKNIRLITDSDHFTQVVADPRYEESVVFDDNLVAVKMKRVKVRLDKPIYVGFTVLELSKHLMYSFHYDHIVCNYGKKAKLLFSDTDSLCYLLETEDFYDDMSKNMDLYDTSDYPHTHRLHSLHNKKVMGKMKDETNSVPIEEFVGLRSKMYSIKFGDSEKKTLKGIGKAVVKKRITHQDYKNILKSSGSMRHCMHTLRNELHQMYTLELNKISLSAYDDKRYILANGVDSLPYGHYKILDEDDVDSVCS